MSEEIDTGRRRFLGAAVTTIAGAELSMIHSMRMQSRNMDRTAATSAQPLTSRPFGPVKQIDAGVLNVGYAEDGPANGPAVVLLHGWPYDTHSYVDRGQFHDVFAKDVSPAEARIMAATQKPLYGGAFGASVPQAAWKTIPSWYLLTQDDKAINPELERFYAKRMRAKLTEVKSSHVAFVSHPREVARVITQAASAAGK